jgi:3-deoxy-D-manno-octulosonic-acid transferase
MKRLRSILIQYRLILYVLYPLVFLVTLVMAFQNRDRHYLLERIGLYLRDYPQQCIWFHAASVGEVNGVMPLLQKMAGDHPERQFLLTTGTPTGGQVALAKIPDNASHAYLPLDYPGAVRRFLNKTRPSAAVIMETELWADLFYACDRREIPISIINARLSDRTLKANAWMYRLYAETLSHVTKILARSDFDANAFMTIGATSSKVRVLGNLKFAPADAADVEPMEGLDRPYVLAASTHDDEEEQLAKAWIESGRKELLVIAPRHPIRRDSIIKAIRRHTDRLAIRSQDEPVTDQTAIYLADTLGELRALIKGAEIVFMGGSLVPRGGHNIIEVVPFAKPVIFGPYMENFRDEAEMLLQRGIATQIEDVAGLVKAVQAIGDQPQALAGIEEKSRRLAEENADILDRYVAALLAPAEAYQPDRILGD